MSCCKPGGLPYSVKKIMQSEMELIENVAMEQFRQSPEGLKITAETNRDELEAALNDAFLKVKSDLMVQIVNSAAMVDIISDKLNAIENDRRIA